MRASFVLLGVLLMAPQAVADSVAPPPDACPDGSRPGSDHRRGYCAPRRCRAPAGCAPGYACEERALCASGYRLSSGWSPEPGPQVADIQGACDPDGACDRGRCRTIRVCVSITPEHVPAGHPHPTASTPEPEPRHSTPGPAPAGKSRRPQPPRTPPSATSTCSATMASRRNVPQPFLPLLLAILVGGPRRLLSRKSRRARPGHVGADPPEQAVYVRGPSTIGQSPHARYTTQVQMTRALNNHIEIDGSETFGGRDRPQCAASWDAAQ